MEISNLTRKKSLDAPIEIADNDYSRMRGLMFRKKTVPILFVFGFEGLFPIHSHFCPGEFDAVYVSKGMRVVELFRKIPPGLDRIQPTVNAAYLLELPPALTSKLKISVGDLLSWEEK